MNRTVPKAYIAVIQNCNVRKKDGRYTVAARKHTSGDSRQFMAYQMTSLNCPGSRRTVI